MVRVERPAPLSKICPDPMKRIWRPAALDFPELRTAAQYLSQSEYWSPKPKPRPIILLCFRTKPRQLSVPLVRTVTVIRTSDHHCRTSSRLRQTIVPSH